MRRLVGVGLIGAATVWLALTRLLRDRPRLSLTEQIDHGLRDPSGWWVRLVLDAFRYLETEYGYALAEVQMHFKGNYIRYRGQVFEFVMEYDPEATRSIGALLWLVSDLRPERQGERLTYPRVIQINELLRSRDRDRPLPDTSPRQLDRDYVSWAVVTWAEALRELAPDVLAGAMPTAIEFPLSG